MKTLIINKKIELLQTAIELLEYIRSYNKWSNEAEILASDYQLMSWHMSQKSAKHRSIICSMVATRLTERYNKILKAL